jgi:hypothetical protein
VALSAQLIVSETVFETIFGLAAHGRLPPFAETIGISLLTTGVVVAILVFSRNEMLVDELA